MIRSAALNSIPETKFKYALMATIEECEVCSKDPNVTLTSGMCRTCQIRNQVLHRYCVSNIPVRYWRLEMDKDFVGSPTLMKYYKSITEDVKKTYFSGLNVCFAGKNGIGKTFTCSNILKRFVESGFSGLYCNLSDIVNLVTSRNSEDTQIARKELLTCDIVCIDEFDPRYLQSEKAADLFGKSLEEVFRTRTQNAIPTIMCSNAADPAEGFSGAIKQSIDSLMGMVELVPVLGKDFRKKGKV
jgi:DNA replication protein DnaC